MNVLLLLALLALYPDLGSLQPVQEDLTYHESDKFFNFPGGDGNIYKVDAQETCTATNPDNRYWLYTRLNRDEKQVLVMDDKTSVRRSHFKPNKNTVFISHGFKSSGNSEMNILLRRVFLNDDDVNVIILDWSEIANIDYNITAKCAVPKMGALLGRFIDWLNTEFNLSLEMVHLVGHSLGAHLVGNAGKLLNGDARRITGLDPAGPLWYTNDKRLSKQDAQYVEVIHTNAYQAGYPFPMGHVDHYPNGGKHMPGCSFGNPVCNHAMSWKYLAASIERKPFRAHKCRDLSEAVNDKCTGDLGQMGTSEMYKLERGIYRAKITSEDMRGY